MAENLNVTDFDRRYAEQILEDFGEFEEDIEERDKLAEWIRNIRVDLARDQPPLVKALENVRGIIAEGAMTGFNYKDGDWAKRLFASQQITSAALAAYKKDF